MPKILNIYASTEAGAVISSKGDCFEIHDNKQQKIKNYK